MEQTYKIRNRVNGWVYTIMAENIEMAVKKASIKAGRIIAYEVL